MSLRKVFKLRTGWKKKSFLFRRKRMSTRKIKIALAAGVVILLSALPLFAQSVSGSTDILTFKVDYEKKLRDNLQTILDRPSGPTNPYLGRSRRDHRRGKRKKETFTKPADEDLDAWLTPGVPMPPGLKGNNPKNSEVYEYGLETQDTARLGDDILDTSLPEEKDAEVKEMIEKSIGLPPAQMKWEVGKRQAFSVQTTKFFDENKELLLWALLASGR